MAKNNVTKHQKLATTGAAPSGYKSGRPAKFATGGSVSGVRQRAGIAMGGEVDSKQGVKQVGSTFRKTK